MTENTTKYKFIREGLGISFMITGALIILGEKQIYEWEIISTLIFIVRRENTSIRKCIKMTNNKNILTLQKHFFYLSPFAISNVIKNVKNTHQFWLTSVTFLSYPCYYKDNHSTGTVFSHPVNTELQIASTLNYFFFQEVRFS